MQTEHHTVTTSHEVPGFGKKVLVQTIGKTSRGKCAQSCYEWPHFKKSAITEKREA